MCSSYLESIKKSSVGTIQEKIEKYEQIESIIINSENVNQRGGKRTDILQKILAIVNTKYGLNNLENNSIEKTFKKKHFKLPNTKLTADFYYSNTEIKQYLEALKKVELSSKKIGEKLKIISPKRCIVLMLIMRLVKT